MHRISYIQIQNFRACQSVSLPLDDFTPLVGQNNVGKSTLLESLRWLLKPDARSSSDFADAKQPIVVTAKIEGVSAAILGLIPEPKHRTAIEPYCPNGVLWIRVRTEGPKTIKQEVWNPEALEADGSPKEWRPYPTGLPQAVAAILPEPLSIQAMKDVQKDFTSVAAGTSIKKLIEEIAEPVTKANATEIDAALKTINDLLAGEGETRSKALNEFDEKATQVLEDFFPGLALQLELPETKVKEFFKSGSLNVREEGRSEFTEFAQLGSGAQRAIEMALICYLAAAAGTGATCARKLLLIDEPELYLHPQGVRRIRRALSVLATKNFQVVFSTHSPLMLDRANAAHTVIVRKEPTAGARTRKPLQQAVRDALAEAESQSRVLFELGNIAEIYFAERVVLCEGKTDRRILPLAYEQLNGRAPELDHVAFVSIGSCSDIRKALAVLRAMEIPACAIADLDFAFTEAAKGSNALVEKDGAEISRAKAILKRLQPVHGFSLAANGLPENKNGFRAANTWALLAADGDGKVLASDVHTLLKAQGIWVWSAGAIEHIIGTADKGEDAIIAQEESLRAKNSAAIAAEFPAIVECFKWLKELNQQSKAEAKQ